MSKGDFDGMPGLTGPSMLVGRADVSYLSNGFTVALLFPTHDGSFFFLSMRGFC